MTGTTEARRILSFVRQQKLVRVKDLVALGIHPEHLRRLYASGLVDRMARGIYVVKDAQLSADIGLALVAKWTPSAIVCLVSALRFHNLGTQNPSEVWIALPPAVARPTTDYPPVRVVRFSGKALVAGVEEHVLDGVNVKITSPARTVVDCFKYRRKIGLDVALEALRSCWQERKCTMDDIWEYARIRRVSGPIRPYLESLT